MEKLGIYIHIPFCVKKCAYCDFYSLCDLSLQANYVNALISQIASFRAEAKNRIVDTIYIGGGTPSILSGEHILRILKTVRKTFKVSEDAEITLLYSGKATHCSVQKRDFPLLRQQAQLFHFPHKAENHPAGPG